MFTGLVQQVGKIHQVVGRDACKQFVIAASLKAEDRVLGASVAISGVCLTVTASDEQTFSVDAAFETLAVTTLGRYAPGRQVNLEPALRVGDPLGGHLVSGHVDGIGTLRSAKNRGDATQLWIDTPPELLPYIAQKGSICIDGISLTVNAVDTGGFSVGIIPHTWRATTLADRRVGDRLNLEVDLLARYVARLLEAGQVSAGVTRETLLRAGFAPGTKGTT
ncbi:MAG: riboflavin synthase [Nannocystaceae bacterium]